MRSGGLTRVVAVLLARGGPGDVVAIEPDIGQLTVAELGQLVGDARIAQRTRRVAEAGTKPLASGGKQPHGFDGAQPFGLPEGCAAVVRQRHPLVSGLDSICGLKPV